MLAENEIREDRTEITKEKEKSFAYGLNFYKLFWVFLLGCFLGVVVEMFWCYITKFTIESRSGLIYGPFNLVYGVAAVLITVCLYKLADKRDIWVFLGGMLIGNVFEYLCSFIQEIMFGTMSWDYTGLPGSINGRINLIFSILWGVLSLVWIKYLYSRISHLIEKIPNKIGIIATWIFVVFMTGNIIISGLAVGRRYERYRGEPANTSIDSFLDKNYPDELIQKVYPNMSFVK